MSTGQAGHMTPERKHTIELLRSPTNTGAAGRNAQLQQSRADDFRANMPAYVLEYNCT